MLCDSHRHLSLIIVKHRWHILVREHILCVNNQKTGFTCKGLSCCLFINIWIITSPNWAWKVRQLYQCTWVPTLLLVFPSSSFYLLLLLYLFLPPLTDSFLFHFFSLSFSSLLTLHWFRFGVDRWTNGKRRYSLRSYGDLKSNYQQLHLRRPHTWHFVGWPSEGYSLKTLGRIERHNRYLELSRRQWT